MNASCPETAEWQEIVNGFATLYNERSPVSFTLVAAAILEDQVLRTLKKTIPGIESYRDTITHGLRVSLLREMGVITASVAEALRCYAGIRNAFAHRPHTTTFESEVITRLCQKLRKNLEAESGSAGLLALESARSTLDSKFRSLGAQPPWSHPVASTLVAGYAALTYYLIWARHWAPVPQQPKNINKIAEHVCTKTKSPRIGA